MKKLLLTLSLLIAPITLHAADSFSTGTIVFTLPSTGTVTAWKSWATKNNDNWQAAGTAITNIQSNANANKSAVAADTTTINNALSLRTQVWYDEGAPLAGGDVKSVNVVGGSVGSTQSGSSVTLTVTAAEGGSANTSTRTINLFHFGGPVLLSTTNLVTSPGYARHLSPCATYYFTTIWAYNVYGSSVAPPKYDIRIGTSSNGSATAFVPRAPQITFGSTPTVAGGPHYSIVYSTRFNVFPTEYLGVARTTVAVSGLSAHTDGISARGWSDETACP